MSDSSTETSVDRTVAPQLLVSLIKDAQQKGARIQSIAGETGARVASAVENGHLHRGAFRLMLRLYKMDEQKRGDWMRSIGLYMQICHEQGLFGDPEYVGDLVDDAERKSDAEPDESAPNEHGSVQADSEAGQEILSGIKPLDEEAPKLKRGRKKAALKGADAEGSYTSVN